MPAVPLATRPMRTLIPTTRSRLASTTSMHRAQRAAEYRVPRPPYALREGVDSGEGHMEVWQDAHRARLDDVLAEASEIARTRAAGVDAGRNRAAAREVLGVNAKRGASPINVRVEIDEARRDDEARHVADFGTLEFETLAQFRHLSASEGDVGDFDRDSARGR